MIAFKICKIFHLLVFRQYWTKRVSISLKSRVRNSFYLGILASLCSSVYGNGESSIDVKSKVKAEVFIFGIFSDESLQFQAKTGYLTDSSKFTYSLSFIHLFRIFIDLIWLLLICLQDITQILVRTYIFSHMYIFTHIRPWKTYKNIRTRRNMKIYTRIPTKGIHIRCCFHTQEFWSIFYFIYIIT